MAFAPSMPVATAGAGAGVPWYQNPMLYYYLAGMGGRLGGKGSWQESLGGMVQQGIAAKSQYGLENRRVGQTGAYTDMASRMLAGELAPGSTMSMSDKGELTMKMPSQAGGPNMPAGDVGAARQFGYQPMEKDYMRNPFYASPSDIAPSLVGLDPQDVSRALTGAVNVETLRQNALDRAARLAKREPLEEAYPIQVPGVGQVTLRQWTNLPAEEKEYAIYTNAAKNLGDTDIMTREEWRMTEPTERERFIRAAMEDPKLMKATKEVAEAGAMRLTLGEKLTEVKAKAGLKGQLYFKDPEWTEDVEKHISSEDVQNELIQYEPGSAEMIDAKAKQRIKFIEDKIVAGGGEIVSVKWAADGKTMVWTVRWPSGDEETVKYAVRS